MLYRSKNRGFELALPAGWSEPGVLRRIFTPYNSSDPEFFGPDGKSLKFAIGPIHPEPSAAAMHETLRRVAAKHGHDVMKLETIAVGGREHATIVYDCLHPSLDQLLVLRFKNYHLVFHGVEYVITARVAVLPRGISLTRPQAPNYERGRMQREKHGEYAKKLHQIFGYEEDYDDIVRTFRQTGGRPGAYVNTTPDHAGVRYGNQGGSAMLESVREAYDPKDCWSKVAKRLCGRSLFGRRRLDWQAAMRDFLREYSEVQRDYGAVLKATNESVEDFLERLVCRLGLNGDLTQAERSAVVAALKQRTAMSVQGERPKALLLKACFEMGRLRPTPPDMLRRDPGMSMITVDDLLAYPLATPLPKSARIESATACLMPEYHLAWANSLADFDYCRAVHEVSLEHENLGRAFEEINARGPSSEIEREFWSKYRSMAKTIR
jgi:hypothetical protein